MVNAAAGLNLEDVLEDKNVRISYGLDLIGSIWDHQPELSAKPAWVLAQQYAGKCSEDKIQDVREAMKKAHASVHVLTSMDDIAWLLNIRGGDIRHNPVVLSYVVVTMEQLYLFVNEEVLEHRAYPYMDNGEDITTRQYLEDIGVTVLPYDQLYDMVEGFRNEKVLLEKSRVNYAIYRLLDSSNKIIDRMNPTALMKSVKNDVEIENERNAHIKDGVAVTKFIYWLKKNIGRIPMDEISVSDYLGKTADGTGGLHRTQLFNHIRHTGNMGQCVITQLRKRPISPWSQRGCIWWTPAASIMREPRISPGPLRWDR